MSDPKLKWGKFDWLCSAIILIPIMLAIIYYQKLPDQMAVHFGTNGEVDGYQSKPAYLLTNLAMLVGIPLLLKVVPYMDPKKKNYAKFASVYDWFRLIFTAFLSVITIATLFFNLGYELNIQMIVLLGVGILFIFLGKYMSRIQFNYTMGIRTPWTLANEEVWHRTHRLAGPLWFIAGVIIVILAFVPGELAFILMMVLIAIIVIIPLVYSYLLYRKLG